MRLSRYFLPVLKESPKEAEIVSHKLMLRAGMIKQQAAGSYSWLPLGFKVLKKVIKIIEEEQNRSGAIQLLMPTLQSADLWRESGRYDAYGKEMLRIEDRHERDMLYGPTNEEMITDIFRTYVQVLQGPAAQPLPHPVEVPRRGAAALRHHAQPRIPDEGRLFLRPRQGRRDAGLLAHVRRLPAHLPPHGPGRHPDARRHRPDRRRHELRVPRPRRDRRERGVPPRRSARQADPADRHRLPRRPDADLQRLDVALSRRPTR